MNINEYKKYLQDVHGTLDDDPGIKQISVRLRKEAYPSDMEEYKPDKKEDRSTVAPTTAAGDSLRPGSKSAEKMEKIKEEIALQYFDNCFGGELTEDTSDEDIIEAVYDLIELRDAVCEAVGLEPKKNLTIDEKFMSPIKAFKTLRNTTGKGGKKVDAQLRQYGNRVTSTNIPISKYKKILPKALDLAIKNVSSGTPKVARGKATRAIADKGSFTLSQSGKKPVKRKPTDWEGRYDPTDGSY